MKTITGLVLVFLMEVSAAPTRKAECQDQYRHCPEWSGAGYCDKTGYKTYMTFMCAYSCNTCKDLKVRNDSQDVSSASGLETGQLQNPEDMHETTFEKDEASANEPVSGEGEISGDSEANEDKEGDRLQHEQSKDAALEWKNKVMQPTERQQRQNISGETKDIQDATNKQGPNKNLEVTQDQDPPGVHLIKFQGNAVEDDVNPRSKISTRPNEHIPQTRIENTRKTEEQGEDVSASGSMLDESGESEGDESKSASSIAVPKGISEESQEMKDIAGDIKTGSKIFEADISEPESASGCSSGFGCSSGNEEEIQTEKNQEAVELEPRSKIATAPQIKDAKSQQADKNIEIEHGEKSAVSDTASGSFADLRDDVAPEEDDIAGTKSEAKSSTKVTTKVSQTQKEILERAKNVKEDEEISAEIGTSGSGADAHDDIQGKSVHGENDESNNSGKSAANSNGLSASGADTTSKSELLEEVKTAANSDAEIKQENEQKQKQEKTAKSKPADKEIVAKSNAKNEVPGQNEAIKDADVKSISSDQNQSASKTDIDDEEMNTGKEVMKGNNETSKAMNEYEMRSDKGNKKEDHQQQEAKITKSTSANDNPSAAKNDVDSNDLVGQKHVTSTRSDADNEEDVTKKQNTEAKPYDNQSGAKIDTVYLESNEKKDVKEAVEPNHNQKVTPNGTGNEDAEESDTFSGSGAASTDANENIDTDADEKSGNGVTKPKTKTVSTQPTDIDEIEDALFSKEDTSVDNPRQAKEENQNFSLSPAAKHRITSMEELIKDDKRKAEKVKYAPAKTRENVPSADTTLDDFINTDLGKGRKVTLILDQHYYKPYSNEDSMAYEMLALDLKKEVERAVGNQAIVSQISFSEIRKHGKLPRYSRVLAKFMLHGDTGILHGAVRKGFVGDLMVDKKFFQTS